jgi:hypothetical protein
MQSQGGTQVQVSHHPTRRFPSIRAGALALAAVTALLAVGLVGAQSPPTPPSRFAGSVTVNGAPATAGVSVAAMVGTVNCGTTSVSMNGSEARYVIDVSAQEPGGPACGTDGATVTFLVNGVQANETGAWKNYQLSVLNLTVTTGATPTQSATATTTATPTQSTTGTPSHTSTAQPSGTPKAPVTGTGAAAGPGSTATLIALLVAGLAATAAGAAGIAAARRRR